MYLWLITFRWFFHVKHFVNFVVLKKYYINKSYNINIIITLWQPKSNRTTICLTVKGHFLGMTQSFVKSPLFLPTTVAGGLIRFNRQFTKWPAFACWKLLISKPVSISLTPGVAYWCKSKWEQVLCKGKNIWTIFSVVQLRDGMLIKTDLSDLVGNKAVSQWREPIAQSQKRKRIAWQQS